jgi:Tfp pilus assembly protein PilF
MANAMLAIMALVVLLLPGCTTPPALMAEARADARAALRVSRAEGLRLVELGHYEQAKKILAPLFEDNPLDLQVKLGLAECALAVGQLESAEPLFATAANDEAFGAIALQGLGITLLRRGDAHAAMAVLQEATQKDPSLWRAWNALGQAHDLQREWDASRHAYKAALVLAPNTALVYNNIGVSLLARDRFEDALQAFDQALAADQKLAMVRTNRQLALHQGQPKAIGPSQREETARLLNSAGYVALIRGDYEQAERLFIQAAYTSPTYYGPAFENLEALERLRHPVRLFASRTARRRS